jgi:hypothetical protein
MCPFLRFGTHSNKMSQGPEMSFIDKGGLWLVVQFSLFLWSICGGGYLFSRCLDVIRILDTPCCGLDLGRHGRRRHCPCLSSARILADNNVSPTLGKVNSKLQTESVFGVIRHPNYTVMATLFLGIAVLNNNWNAVLIYVTYM